MSPLSLQEFAAVLAHTTHYPAHETGAVLAKLEVTAEELGHAASIHPAAIAEQLARGGSDLADRFQGVLDQTAERLVTDPRAVEQLAPLRSPAAPTADQAATSMDVTLDALAGAPAVAPTPFRPGPAMVLPPSPPRPADEGGDTAGLEASPADALPFATRDFSHWAVETHACFVAERRWLDADSVRSRYGIRDGADEYALMTHFNRRFAREPGLHQRWTELVARRVHELSRGGR